MVKIVADRACAKINLFLRVTGRRPDGYHELDSIFLPIALFDSIRLEIRPASEPSVTLKCNVPALAVGADNLAARAANAFMAEFALTAQVLIDLDKQVPIGAGLGGGSSDAGTVLRMMAALERVDLEDRRSRERLNRIALALGADVPFFLDPRPARVGGIGERIAPMPAMPRLPIVLAVPPFEVATAAIFRALTPAGWSGPASDDDIANILAGEISPAVVVNDLAPVAIAQFPEIRRLKALLEESGARAAQMSGSGGAVFGMFRSQDEAQSACVAMRRRAPSATVIATATL